MPLIKQYITLIVLNVNSEYYLFSLRCVKKNENKHEFLLQPHNSFPEEDTSDCLQAELNYLHFH